MTKPEKCYVVVSASEMHPQRAFKNQEHAWDYIRAMAYNPSYGIRELCMAVIEIDLF